MINFIPRNKFDFLPIHQYNANKYYKRFSAWTQLVSMLFGVLSRCNSSGEVCDGMRALEGKLNHLGMDSYPAKSTFGDGLLSEAQIHDKNFIQYLSLPKHSMIVFDRAYNHYLQFARFTQNKISFVCRLKKNAVYQVDGRIFFTDTER